MKHLIVFLCALVALAAASCRSGARVVATEVPVEVRTVEVWHTDTIIHQRIDTVTVTIEVPAQQAERHTLDSVSHLETDYAYSDARINPDGSLFHSLNNKAQRIEQSAIVAVADTASKEIRYIEREVPVTIKEVVEVERKLKWWQSLLMYLGMGFVAIVGYGAYRKFSKM